MKAATLLRRFETEHPEGLTSGEMFLANEALLPVPDEKRTWNHASFVWFWIADSFNLNVFVIASSMITSGLSWWQAFLCVIIGYGIVPPFLVMNARPGALHGLVFPAVCRTTFGVFGSLWPVFNRAAMACIWWGVQGWLGGECVHGLIRAIWPSFFRIPNHMPASTETTTAYLVSFIIYWLLSIPVTWVPIHKLRYWFAAKAVIGPIVGFALFGWSISRAGGVGPVFSQPSTLKGSALGWQMMISISSCFNNMFTVITNAPDFASRAKTPGAAVWPQVIALPLGFIITSFLGIVIASSAAPQFGAPIWDVVKVMEAMQDHDSSSRTRAGLAFIYLGFIYVQLMLNVAANSISAGCDLTALFPRFINIRRGGYICVVVGIAMNPWLLYKSSATFGSYLGAYGVLLSCIAGPMITDYWFVRRGHMRLADMYTTRNDGWYWYTWGINWRAYAGTCRIYALSWVTGTGVSSLVYYLCCVVFPPPGMSSSFEEVDESDFRNTLDAERLPPIAGDDKGSFKDEATVGVVKV